MRFRAKMSVALALCCLAALSAAAQNAEVIARNTVGAWGLMAFRTATNSGFSHCAASASYNSGVTLLFSINGRLVWTIGFSHNDWRFRQGQRISVTYAIDGGASRQGIAEAVSANHLVMSLPDDAQLFQAMRSGQRLIVSAEGVTVPFRLTGTSVMLATLLRCAQSNGTDLNPPLASAMPAPAPRAPETTNAPTAPNPTSNTAARSNAARAELRVEATQFVANLLTQSEMRGVRILAAPEVREFPEGSFLRRSDVVWQGSGVLGTLHVVENVAATDLDRLAADIIGADARDCSGQFVTGRTTDPEMRNVRRMQTYCEQGDARVTISYLLLPMPGRLVYQLSTVWTGERSAAAMEDQRLRDAVHSAVSRHPAFGDAPRSSDPPQRQLPEVGSRRPL